MQAKGFSRPYEYQGSPVPQDTACLVEEQTLEGRVAVASEELQHQELASAVVAGPALLLDPTGVLHVYVRHARP